MKFAALILIFLASASSTFAATTPDLGTAASFAILSSTFTRNVGLTAITGDLGYTTLSGSGTNSVSGTTTTPKPPQAGLDQGTALTALNNQSCDFSFGGPTDLSLISQPLAPGVYCVTGAQSIGTGGITFSTAGTYIFRSTGTLTTVDNSNVTLGSASACDVFWTPVETTLGANTTFFGTVIDDAGITVGSTTTWTGRALNFATTVTTNTDTITAPSCATPTSTPTPTPTPTGVPGATPTATPTPTPIPTTTSTTGSTSSSSSTSAPTFCTSSGVTTVPGNTIAKRVSPTSVAVSWNPNGSLNDFVIQYGFTNNDWQFSTSVSGSSITINSLPANQPVWFRVAATDNCATGTYGIPAFVGGVGIALNNPLVPGFPNTGFDPSIKSLWNTVVSFFKSLIGPGIESSPVQDAVSTLYIPLIGLTSVPEPLALPRGAGNVTYRYAVKNFIPEVALSDINIVDDKCIPIKFITGDDNKDSKLDYNETWRYVCTTKLSQTTQSIATATGTANSITATHKAYATVVVGSKDPAPLVSIINITKVAYPLSLPSKGGKITFTYKVNNPGVVPLSKVVVTDDKCKSMSGKLGDTNGNDLLDVSEIWIYTCTTNLKETTTNTVNVTAFANGLKAIGNATITVKVAQSIPSFPETGLNRNFNITVWMVLASILGTLILFVIFTKK